MNNIQDADLDKEELEECDMTEEEVYDFAESLRNQLHYDEEEGTCEGVAQ